MTQLRRRRQSPVLQSARCAHFDRTKTSPEYLFAAGPAGIWRRNIAGAIAFTKLNGLWQTVVRSVMPADAGHLWIGTASGLYLQKIDGTTNDSVRFSRPNVIQSSNINALTQLQDGEIVIASTGGLDFFKGTSRIRKVTAKDGMPYRNALSLTVDGEGRIWAATHFGVERYDNGNWTLAAQQTLACRAMTRVMLPSGRMAQPGWLLPREWTRFAENR